MSASYIKKAQEYISSHEYFQLSKSWCPDCHYTYALWKRYHVTNKVFILELDKLADQNEARELEKAFTALAGRKWVPFIWIKGEPFGTEQDLKRLDSLDKLDDWFSSVGLV
jgi:glutaredoxin